MSVIAVSLEANTRPPKKGRYIFGWLLVVALISWAAFSIYQQIQIKRLSHEVAERLAPLVDYRSIYETGKSRQANDVLLETIAVLIEADDVGCSMDLVFSKCHMINSTPGNYADLLSESLRRNLKIARQLGCDTTENLEKMKQGRSPVVMTGPYAGEKAEVDHIVPRSLAPDLDNLLINLELLPKTLNRKKSNRVTPRAFSFAKKFLAAGVIDLESFADVEAAKE